MSDRENAAFLADDFIDDAVGRADEWAQPFGIWRDFKEARKGDVWTRQGGGTRGVSICNSVFVGGAGLVFVIR